MSLISQPGMEPPGKGGGHLRRRRGPQTGQAVLVAVVQVRHVGAVQAVGRVQGEPLPQGVPLACEPGEGNQGEVGRQLLDDSREPEK